jgi:apolipoprotein N-acyltransferase
VLAEFLRGYLYTGFPWMGFAEAQFNGPFAPVAPYFGGFACTFLAVWASWEMYQLRKHPLTSVLLIVIAIGTSQLAGIFTFTKPVGEPISVRLIQGNFEQSLKFNPQAIGKQIDFYAGEITKAPANLIIIPETAFPWPIPNLPIGLFDYLQSFSNSSDSNILLGLIGEVPSETGIQYSNRATGLSPKSAPYQYDKAHLVPFGEFIPPGFQWFVKAFHVPMSDFARGKLDQSPLTIVRHNQDNIHAAFTICYEDVFGGELASRIAYSDKPVNLLINMTKRILCLSENLFLQAFDGSSKDFMCR